MQLRILLGVEEDAGEAASLGDIQRLLALAEGVELATELRAEVIRGDDSGHGCFLS